MVVATVKGVYGSFAHNPSSLIACSVRPLLYDGQWYLHLLPGRGGGCHASRLLFVQLRRGVCLESATAVGLPAVRSGEVVLRAAAGHGRGLDGCWG